MKLILILLVHLALVHHPQIVFIIIKIQTIFEAQFNINFSWIQNKLQQIAMDQLMKQNQNLKQLATKYHKQMTQLHQINIQHENQIDTLLKFNQKLLQIIQKELNGQKLKGSDISLQPISQKTEIQSQMFQSQFSNVGNKFLQKKSMNLRPDPPHQRINRPQPLGVVQRQQQLSIDVDAQGTIQREEDDENRQVENLIKQFRKKIKVKSSQKELSIEEVEQRYRSEMEQLKQFKNSVARDGNSLLQKINNFKSSVLEMNEKQKLISILFNLDTDDKTKNTIANYIKSL